MSEIVSSKKMDFQKFKGIKRPVVLCNPRTIDEAAIVKAGYKRLYALNLTIPIINSIE